MSFLKKKFIKFLYFLVEPIFNTIYPFENKITEGVDKDVFNLFYLKIPFQFVIFIFMFSIFINLYAILFHFKIFASLSNEKKEILLKKIYFSNNYYLWAGVQLMKNHAILIDKS